MHLFLDIGEHACSIKRKATNILTNIPEDKVGMFFKSLKIAPAIGGWQEREAISYQLLC